MSFLPIRSDRLNSNTLFFGSFAHQTIYFQPASRPSPDSADVLTETTVELQTGYFAKDILKPEIKDVRKQDTMPYILVGDQAPEKLVAQEVRRFAKSIKTKYEK